MPQVPRSHQASAFQEDLRTENSVLHSPTPNFLLDSFTGPGDGADTVRLFIVAGLGPIGYAGSGRRALNPIEVSSAKLSHGFDGDIDPQASPSALL